MELSLSKPLQRKSPPLMLKDHLLDDFSSCSSNGFRSYPRRSQCCTTVRFLVELDLKSKPPKYKKKPPLLPQSPLKPPSLTNSSLSAFQRASKAFINAVKHFPFPSSSSSSKVKLGILPRSFSRKLLKRSFWKKNHHKEIQQWKPIENLMIEKSSPPPPSAFIITAAAVGDSSNSSMSTDSNSKSNSWSDSDFTTSDDSSLKVGEEEEEVAVERKKKRLPKNEIVSSKRVGVTVGGAGDIDSTTSSNSSTDSPNTTTKKQWGNNEEKEQFSPVSVLDCPFDDDEDEASSSSSPFHHKLARMEGTRKRLMKKIRRFERLTAELEPVNLVQRIALTESDQESNESPLHYSYEPIIQEDFVSHMEQLVVEEENQAQGKSLRFLELIKDTMPSITINLNIEKLLLDFYKMEMDPSVKNDMGFMTNKYVNVTSDKLLLRTVQEWMNGQIVEKLLEWDVQKNREAYIRDMERRGEWRNLEKEKEEVALEIEVEVFASLMNEVLDDLLLS